MPHATFDQELKNEFAEIARSTGCELLDARFQGGVIKLILDHPEGVTLTHCQTVSRQVSAELDVRDWGSTKYTLEVSSPGLDRELLGPRDFARFTGNQVKITWHSDQGKRTDIGMLEKFISDNEHADGRAEIEIRLDSDVLHRIPLQSIHVARLVPEL